MHSQAAKIGYEVAEQQGHATCATREDCTRRVDLEGVQQGALCQAQSSSGGLRKILGLWQQHSSVERIARHVRLCRVLGGPGSLWAAASASGFGGPGGTTGGGARATGSLGDPETGAGGATCRSVQGLGGTRRRRGRPPLQTPRPGGFCVVPLDIPRLGERGEGRLGDGTRSQQRRPHPRRFPQRLVGACVGCFGRSRRRSLGDRGAGAAGRRGPPGLERAGAGRCRARGARLSAGVPSLGRTAAACGLAPAGLAAAATAGRTRGLGTRGRPTAQGSRASATPGAWAAAHSALAGGGLRRGRAGGGGGLEGERPGELAHRRSLLGRERGLCPRLQGVAWGTLCGAGAGAWW